MKTMLTMVLLVSAALAQDTDAIARATRACGPLDQSLDVKVDKTTNHPLAQPQPGKALIYAIQDDQSGATNFLGFSSRVTSRVGLDGAWIGANKGQSYFFFSVDPGDKHLCSDLADDFDHSRPGLISVTRFTAEPGKAYYFRVRLTGNGCSGSDHPGNCRPIRLELEALDEDKGQLLVASSRFTTSHIVK